MTDSILRSYQWYSHTSIVPFPAAPSISFSDALLVGETDGFAIDATDITGIPAFAGAPYAGRVSVKDVATPAHNLSNVPLDTYSNLLQTGTSPKFVYWGSANAGQWTPHNQHSHSQDFDSTWVINSATITANNTTAPDGTSTADKFLEAAASAQHYIGNAGSMGLTISGFAYTTSVYIKGGLGRQWIQWYTGTGAGTVNSFDIINGVVGSVNTNTISRSITDAGNGWWRLVTTWASAGGECTTEIHTATDGSGTITFLGDVTKGFYIWGHQMTRGFSAGPYLATTSSTSVGIPQAYDPAAAKYGLLIEPASTNLALWSNDFTNAAWTKTTMSTAFTAGGPDGGTNNATTLTASAGNATALQSITDASNTRITGTWFKRRTGSGNIQLTQDNGGTWTTQTVTSSWTRVNLPVVSSANPTVGIRIVTNGDAVDVWGFQHEISQAGVGLADYLTSTIQTAAATVTRARDITTAPTSTVPSLTTVNSGYFQAKQLGLDSGGTASVIYIGQNGSSTNGTLVFYGTSNQRYFVDDNGSVSANYAAGAIGGPVFATVFKAAWRAALNSFNHAFNGTADTADTSGTVPSTSIDMVGLSQYGNSNGPVFIYYIVVLPRSILDAELVTKST